MAEESIDIDLEKPEKESAKTLLAGKISGIFKKNFKSKKSIIIIAVSSALLMTICAGVWFFFFRVDPDEKQATIVAEKMLKESAARDREIIFEDIVDLEPFGRIPLKSSSVMGLISIHLSLELTDQRYRKQIFTMEGQIRGIITGQMQEMTWLELRNPEGKLLLKYNLIKRINSIFPKLTVRNIYFTYFIMQ